MAKTKDTAAAEATVGLFVTNATLPADARTIINQFSAQLAGENGIEYDKDGKSDITAQLKVVVDAQLTTIGVTTEQAAAVSNLTMLTLPNAAMHRAAEDAMARHIAGQSGSVEIRGTALDKSYEVTGRATASDKYATANGASNFSHGAQGSLVQGQQTVLQQFIDARRELAAKAEAK